ncbi:MAG TPA: hypothetical protein VKA84_11395 [Gemmatimonadaceae bacterium]|nr:hypothetical protein [Gemmatimonadaceae bacterium]
MRRAAFSLFAVAALAACSDDPLQPHAAGVRSPQSDLITLAPLMRITVTDLGTLGAPTRGPASSEARGINDLGVVTGTTTAAGSPWKMVFRWQRSTGMRNTGIAGTGLDINFGGTIVGSMPDTSLPPYPGISRAFALTAAGTLSVIGPPPNDEWITAFGINDDGVVVGSTWDQDRAVLDRPVCATTGFKWTPGRAPTFYRPYGTRADAINNAGQVAGRGDPAATALPTEECFWEPGWRETPGAGFLTIGLNAEPHGINGAGTMVGATSFLTSPRPFRWSPATGITILPTDAGASGSAADINTAGYVAGGNNQKPALWKPDGTLVALPRLTPGTTGSGFADALNDRLEIVGADRAADGQLHAVLWKVTYLSWLVTDVRPFQYPNLVLLGAGELIPVALLSTKESSAMDADLSLFTLGNDDGSDTPAARGKDGKPIASYEDVDGDGDLDVILYFDQAALEKNQDLGPGTTELVVYADLGDGRALRGVDKVEVK